jgi:hypothetical protein
MRNAARAITMPHMSCIVLQSLEHSLRKAHSQLKTYVLAQTGEQTNDAHRARAPERSIASSSHFPRLACDRPPNQQEPHVLNRLRCPLRLGFSFSLSAPFNRTGPTISRDLRGKPSRSRTNRRFNCPISLLCLSRGQFLRILFRGITARKPARSVPQKAFDPP